MLLVIIIELFKCLILKQISFIIKAYSLYVGSVIAGFKSEKSYFYTYPDFPPLHLNGQAESKPFEYLLL